MSYRVAKWHCSGHISLEKTQLKGPGFWKGFFRPTLHMQDKKEQTLAISLE